MPLILQYDNPISDDLGAARFFADPAASAASRLILVTALSSRYRATTRPIDVSITSDEQRTSVGLSIDEAEALIACLTHAVALRRQDEERSAA